MEEEVVDRGEGEWECEVGVLVNDIGGFVP